MTAYADLSSHAEMLDDARAASTHLRLPAREDRLARGLRCAVDPAPSILYADFPREIVKRQIPISLAARTLADALELHLG